MMSVGGCGAGHDCCVQNGWGTTFGNARVLPKVVPTYLDRGPYLARGDNLATWGPFLAAKTGPGDHSWQPKLVPRDNFCVGPVLLWQNTW